MQKNSTESISSNEWVIDQKAKKFWNPSQLKKLRKGERLQLVIDSDVKLPIQTDTEVIMDAIVKQFLKNF